jgi:Ca-activated chloride channel homolog
VSFATPEYGLFLFLGFILLLKMNRRIIYFLKQRQHRRFFWMGLSFFTLIIALMQPQLHMQNSLDKKATKEIILAVDVSYSMNATDIKRNRFERAKEAIKEIIMLAPENRYSIIAFTSNAIALTPPTSDLEILTTVLESIDPKSIITKGTSLLPVLELTHKLLHQNEGELVLLSDGGDEKSFNSLYTYAHHAKIHISMVALATQVGERLINEYGEFVKDRQNQMVITAFNRSVEPLIQQTDGVLVELDEIDDLEEILTRNREIDQAKSSTKYRPLFAYFLFLTLLFYTFAFSKIRYITPLFLLIISQEKLDASVGAYYYAYQADLAYQKGEFKKASYYYEQLASSSSDYKVAYNLANSYYNSGNFTQAKVLYEAIKSSDSHFKSDVYYNLANTYVKLEAFEKADKSYLKALLLGYSRDADKNRAFAKGLKKQMRLAFDKKEKHQKKKKQSSTPPKKKAAKASNKSGDGTDKGGTKGDKQAEKILKKARAKRPMSYTQYQLINQGASHEKKPW